ncbi:unnamed protein product [Clonostachys rosea]|uniref:Uncharacterized protein n=1 Tax=Bionectria ochroleuca TaxID=29856 RepID=A0ABY6U282_BIOOC|nr:unnamed protein product [Clonostachys rosea]
MFRQIDDDNAEITAESAPYSAEFFGSELMGNYEWAVNASHFDEAMDSSPPVDLSPLQDFLDQENASCIFGVPETQVTCEPVVSQDLAELHDPVGESPSGAVTAQQDIDYLSGVAEPQAACEAAVSQDLAEAHDPVSSSDSQVLAQQDMEETGALVGGPELESAFDLAFHQDLVEDHDSVPSSHSPVLTQQDQNEIDDLFGGSEPETQAPAEAAIAASSSTTQGAKATSSKKAAKPAYTLALPQPAPVSSNTAQNGSTATGPSKTQVKPVYTLALPQPAPASSNATQNGSTAIGSSNTQAKPAYTLALPQTAPVASNNTQDESTGTASSKNNAKPQTQPSPAVPSTTTQSRKTAPSKKRAKPAATRAPPQAQPPVQVQPPIQIDLTASDTQQSGNGPAVSNPQTSGFQAFMPQMSTTASMSNALGSMSQGYGNQHFPTGRDASSKSSEDAEMVNNAVATNPPASNSEPVATSVPFASGLPAQAFVGASVPSLPGQARTGSSASSTQMPQFPSGPGYPFMMPGQFPVMGMGPGQQPNFMGMPQLAQFGNNFGMGQFNMSPAAAGGAYPDFQAPMAFPNAGVSSMTPQQGLQPVQNFQPSTNAAVFQGVAPNTTLPTETESTKASNANATKATKVSKAAATKAQKAQAPKPRKAPAKKSAPAQSAPVQSAPVQNFPTVTREASAASSTGMTAWKSQLPSPNAWQPLNPDQIMMITGVHPLHLPADTEFVSKLPEVPGSSVKHNLVKNLTPQERELVIHTASRNIFYAGVEAGVERAIQQMVNDMDSNSEALGLAPADLPEQGPLRTKFLDLLEKKMKKSARKWSAFTYEEADHMIKPVQAL